MLKKEESKCRNTILKILITKQDSKEIKKKNMKSDIQKTMAKMQRLIQSIITLGVARLDRGC